MIKTSHEPSAIVGSRITLEVEADNDDKDLTIKDCTVNGRTVSKIVNLGRGLHTIDYVVGQGDPDQKSTASLPFKCTFVDAAGNSDTMGPLGLTIWFAIDAHPPVLPTVRVASSTRDTARIGSLVDVEIVASNGEAGLAWTNCRLNGMDVVKTLNASVPGAPPGSYQFSLRVTAGQADWLEGQLPIDCTAADRAGNSARVTSFTDGNKVGFVCARESGGGWREGGGRLTDGRKTKCYCVGTEHAQTHTHNVHTLHMLTNSN